MRACVFLAGAIWATLVIAQAYDFGVDVEQLTRRHESRIIVGRLPLAANGSVPHRLEIRQMRADRYKWDLFMLSLSMFQSVSQSDPLSFYEVAGIHGVPFRTWNDVDPIPGAEMSGYCTHSSVLFPIWHRPYLGLVEQEIFRMAGFIASMFTDPAERQLYQQAASDIRMPFWDWSIPPPPGETHFPDMFWNPTIVQYGPRGAQFIRNPLYSYRFDPLEEDAFIWNPLKSWQETKRAPATNISLASPPSVNKLVDRALLAKVPEIQRRLLVLFSSYKDFNAFGNKVWSASQNLSSWDSIEGIHDLIHIYSGLKGHMTYVPLSSFDPLFFIHHVSMDRLITIWQTLNPTAWMTPMPAGETSYTTLKGTIQDSRTELTPFYISADGTFWNSDMARFTQTFGYTYADTDPTLANGDIRENLNAKIMAWYGASSPVGLLSQSEEEPVLLEHEVRDVSNGAFNQKSSIMNVKHNAKDPPVSTVIKNGRYTEWMANVRVNAGTLDGSFSIHFFLGNATGDCRQWDTAPNEIGSIDIFAMSGMTASHTKVSGALPLTSALLKMMAAGAIPHLKSNVVEPFLQDLLQFKVCNNDEVEVEPGLVKGLYVGISSTEVKAPTSSVELPQWGQPVTRFELWA